MVSVASLLNPTTPETQPPNPLPRPCSTRYSPGPPRRVPLARKPKLCKDEATFIKGKPQEEVRYWPCEEQGGHIAAEHQKFKLYPIGHITEYCKHVPYRSEKKAFLNKTGREGFHVFQYTFQMPLDEKRHTVMWDYNNGLVRITPFFKALEYPKTTPARMLGRNPGLKEICHSITGGSLTAQGYWMPFEAARAVTATFCYRIRYVLTPIFGLDFPAQCIPPGAPGYDSMQIAPKIIGNCMKPATNYYDVPREPQSGSRPETPLSAGVGCWTPANARSKVLRTFGSESGYGTDDTECSDMYLCSPKKPARSGFRHLATPGPAAVQRRYKTCYAPSSAPSPSSTAYGDESELSDDCKKRKRNPRKHADRDSESSSSDASESNVTTSAKKRKASSTPPVMTAESAAKCLVDLCLQDSCKLDTATFFALQKGVETRERRKRRASA